MLMCRISVQILIILYAESDFFMHKTGENYAGKSVRICHCRPPFITSACIGNKFSIYYNIASNNFPQFPDGLFAVFACYVRRFKVMS